MKERFIVNFDTFLMETLCGEELLFMEVLRKMPPSW